MSTYNPLTFWFNRNTSLAVPIIAMGPEYQKWWYEEPHYIEFPYGPGFRYNMLFIDFNVSRFIVKIQRRIRRKIIRRRNAARVIQKACYNWLWLTTTKDGNMGINCRIGMKQCGLLEPHQIKI